MTYNLIFDPIPLRMFTVTGYAQRYICDEMKDLKGKRFERLTVVKHSHIKNGRSFWLCRCDCGNTKVINGTNLVTGMVKSCGCLRRGNTNSRTHGKSNTKLYRVWQSMKSRCLNPNTKNYGDYGGRGISVCEEWKNSFGKFESWAIANGYVDGVKRGLCTLDRIDVDGNYCPENCRWTTQETQNNNRRSNHVITFNGKTQNLKKWCDELGLSYGTVCERLRCGWETERAFKK